MVRQSMLILASAFGLILIVQNVAPTTGQEQIATPPAVTDLEMKLEHELGRLRKLIGGMGENHPQLKMTRERISEIQTELVALSRGPGPFAKALVAERDEAEAMLDEMNEREVRETVLFLFGRVKDLERRIVRLEQETSRR